MGENKVVEENLDQLPTDLLPDFPNLPTNLPEEDAEEFEDSPTVSLSPSEVRRMKNYYASRWVDPILRMEDIFNVRRADGSLTPMKIPEPQKKMIRDGILGKSRNLVGTGVSYVGVCNKGRQLGFSTILAAEAVLIAEDFPNTNIYYVATSSNQASDWMQKLDQLIRGANRWPKELGDLPILNITHIEKVFEKVINDTIITGLAANPPAIRGKTGIHVIFDEAAWAIRFRGQAKETWKALKYIVRQGGSARVQSTPRTSDAEDLFWGLFKKGESGNFAIHTYECPVIENWRELDLNSPLYIELDNKVRKVMGMRELFPHEINTLTDTYRKNPQYEVSSNFIKQRKARIPYPWVSLSDLEQDRLEDLEQFKQENLGVPLDETYKLIKSEWIYSNLNETDELDDRGLSPNPFYILVDLAQVNDITAITVLEKVEGVYVERRIEESQEEYTKQRDLIFDLHQRFQPEFVSIDNTGHGMVVGDMLAEKFRQNGISPTVLRRVTFTHQSKEQMAVRFRNIVMPDPITNKSRYRWLCKERKHEEAIRHCLRVEKEILPQSGVRYSGKMHGRDDHFWSKAQIGLIDVGTGGVKASFGKFTKPSLAVGVEKKSLGQQTIEELNKKRWMGREDKKSYEERLKEYKSKLNKHIHQRQLNFAVNCLSKGIVICATKQEPVKPIHCAYEKNCNKPNCPGYKYVDEICSRYGVDRDEVWTESRKGKEANV